jgi:hypothetical protein
MKMQVQRVLQLEVRMGLSMAVFIKKLLDFGSLEGRKV